MLAPSCAKRIRQRGQSGDINNHRPPQPKSSCFPWLGAPSSRRDECLFLLSQDCTIQLAHHGRCYHSRCALQFLTGYASSTLDQALEERVLIDKSVLDLSHRTGRSNPLQAKMDVSVRRFASPAIKSIKIPLPLVPREQISSFYLETAFSTARAEYQGFTLMQVDRVLYFWSYSRI
jgi:hypothetical protein